MAFPTSVPMSEFTKLNLGLYDEERKPEHLVPAKKDPEPEKVNESAAPGPDQLG
jgi:hypothetical protein